MNTLVGAGAAVLAALTLGVVGAVPPAGAEPRAHCGVESQLPWSPCTDGGDPWNNYPRGSWDFNPGPGQWGPGGYVPRCDSLQCS